MNSKTKNNISSLNILKKIYSHLSKQRKKDIKLVLFLSVLSSLAESISIAMLIPFIGFFINPENYLFNSLFIIFFDFLNISSQKDILAIVAGSFIFVVLLSSYIRLKYIKLSNLMIENTTSDFRIKIFKFLISQDLDYYLKHGSNEIMSSLSQKSATFSEIIFSSINIVNAILISLAIVVIITINEPVYTPIIIISIILFFLVLFGIKSASVLKKGQSVNISQNLMVDIFQNAVGYLPEIIIYNLKKFFLNTLVKFSNNIAKSTSSYRTIAMSPKIYIEAFIIIFVVLLIYFSDFSNRPIESNISYLAILAYGTQKILPLINSIYTLSINFKASTPAVDNFLDILGYGKEIEITDHKYETLKFENEIKLKNISFKYKEELPKIIDNLNFNIRKGEKIAIKGQTGSGKSTLVNIISGLFHPTEGQIYVDEIKINSKNLNNWQKNVAIVPQTVFLNDASILDNIAIAHNFDEINLEKAKDSAKKAQINSFIESLPNNYNEKVGERGVRLSGGQRQRLGIARALYRDASIIILDEPTNALDIETEKLVMDSITKLSKNITLIMISHSDTSLKYFDRIIDLDKRQ